MSPTRLARALTALLTLTSTLVLVSFAAPSPATASPLAAVDRTCYDGNFCIYRNAPYQIDDSDDYMYRTPNGSGFWSTAYPEVHNADSSWRNRSDSAVRVYDGEGATAFVWTLCLNPGQSRRDDAVDQDKGSSHRLRTAC